MTNEFLKNVKSELSVCSSNVHGGLEAKLENDDFINEFLNYDIVFFSETWTNKNSVLKLEGFSKPICKHRPRRRNAKRDSGGLCIFIKKEIRKGISVIDWEIFEDGVILKLDKSFFGFEQDMFLLCIYILPENSSRNSIITDVDSYEKLIDKISELSSLGEIVIMGDLNSRTSNLLDFNIDNINDDCEDDVNKDSSELVKADIINNNMSIYRTNLDTGVNNNGKTLLKLTSMCNMILLNGRFGKDKDIGKITYCENKKNKIVKSTVDYVLCTRNVLYDFCDFEITDLNPFSDHAVVHFVIKCKILNNIEVLNHSSNPTFSKKIKWNEKNCDKFINNLNSSDCISSLEEICNKLECPSKMDETLINESVAALCDIITTAGKSDVTPLSINRNKPTQRYKSERWYDEECRRKKMYLKIFKRNIYYQKMNKSESICVKLEMPIESVVELKENIINARKPLNFYH